MNGYTAAITIMTIETKFNLGDTVYFLDAKTSITEGKVQAIRTYTDEVGITRETYTVRYMAFDVPRYQAESAERVFANINDLTQSQNKWLKAITAS